MKTSDTKILQAILDGQQEIREDIARLDKKVERNGERIDKLGLQLAELEDDAPTREEFEELEERVDKLETRVVV